METLMELWHDIHVVFNKSKLKIKLQHASFIIIEDIVERIALWDISELRGSDAIKRFSDFIDARFYLIADSSTPDQFLLIFRSLIRALDLSIARRIETEEYEKAANLRNVQEILKLQKKKWTVNGKEL